MPKRRSAAAATPEATPEAAPEATTAVEQAHDDEIVEPPVQASTTKKPGRRDTPSAPLSKTGVLYFGHIPEGFFEQQMKAFLSQFGAVAKVRVSRSKRTGGSRGYAFVQMMDQAVANVVQKTMHGYILLGRTLVCQHVAPENVHDEMFAGALTRTSKGRIGFRAINWRRLEMKLRNESTPTMQSVKRRIHRLKKGDAARKKRLEEKGIVF